MDDRRFDDLTRRLAAPRSRRSFVRAAVGAAAAGLLARLPAAHSAAAAGCRADADCADGNACTTDRCRKRVCQHLPIALVCTALDQCHVAGTCDPATGQCTNPLKPNGTACTDGNACTRTDTCQAGACVGGNPVVCTALDQCHVAGTCNPATGTCSNPPNRTAPPAPTATPAPGRYLPGRRLHRRGHRQLLCVRSVPRRRDVQPGDRPMHQSAEAQRHRLRRRQPLHHQRRVRRRRLRRHADGLHRRGPLPPRRHLRPGRPGSAPPRPNRTAPACSDGTACTDTDTCQSGVCTPGTTVVCAAPGPVPRRGRLQPGHRRVRVRAQGRRHRLRRRQRLHDRRDVPGRGLHRRRGDGLRRRGPVPPRRHLRPGHRRLLPPAQAERRGVQRRQPLHRQTDTCQGGACVAGDPVVCAGGEACDPQRGCDPSSCADDSECPGNAACCSGSCAACPAGTQPCCTTYGWLCCDAGRVCGSTSPGSASATGRAAAPTARARRARAARVGCASPSPRPAAEPPAPAAGLAWAGCAPATARPAAPPAGAPAAGAAAVGSASAAAP